MHSSSSTQCLTHLYCTPPGVITRRVINSCLIPIQLCDGLHIVTAEGLGNSKDGFSPVRGAFGVWRPGAAGAAGAGHPWQGPPGGGGGWEVGGPAQPAFVANNC